jgi:hypothetical protein
VGDPLRGSRNDHASLPHIGTSKPLRVKYDKDPRKVVIDPDARYFGVKLSENSLIPGKDAKLGSIKFDWWLENVAPPPKK